MSLFLNSYLHSLAGRQANHVHHNCHILLLVQCHFHKKEPSSPFPCSRRSQPTNRKCFSHFQKTLLYPKLFSFQFPLCLKPPFFYLHYSTALAICLLNFGIDTEAVGECLLFRIFHIWATFFLFLFFVCVYWVTRKEKKRLWEESIARVFLPYAICHYRLP